MKALNSARKSIGRAISPRRSREPSPDGSQSAPATPRGTSGVPNESSAGSASMPGSPAETPRVESIRLEGAIKAGGGTSVGATGGKSPSGGFQAHLRGSLGSVSKSVSSKAAELGPKAVAAKAKRIMLRNVQKLVEKKLDSIYTGKVKLSITADRRTPSIVRSAIHDVVDEVWDNVHFEAVRAFDKLIEGEAKDIENEDDGAKGGSSPSHGSSVKSPTPSPPSSPPQAGWPRPVPSPPTSPPAASPPAKKDEDKTIVDHVVDTTEGVLHNLQEEIEARVVDATVEVATRTGDAVDRAVSTGTAAVERGLTRGYTSAVGLVSPSSSAGTMRVVLVRGEGLPAADSNGLSDPYCQLKLGKVKRQSKTIKKTLDPRWNEEMDFSGTLDKLGTALKIKCYDYDLVGRDDALGETTVDLGPCVAQPHKNLAFAVPLTPNGKGKLVGGPGTLFLNATWMPKETIQGGDDQDLGEDISGREDDVEFHAAEADRSQKGTLYVTLQRAENLPAADRNGLSDPYVYLSVPGLHGTKPKKSNVIKLTLNPEWNQDFEWEGAKGDMNRLMIDVWDADFLERDDRLGSASIDLRELQILEEGADVKTLPVELNTQGTVFLRIDWRLEEEDKGPTHSELLNFSVPYFMQDFRDDEEAEPLEYKARQMLPWTRFLRSLTKLRVKVTIKAGRKLVAADRGGTSDPYVVWQMGDGRTDRTRTILKTVNPVWNEEIPPQVGEAKEFISRHMRFEVFDDDKLSKDDSIGTCTIGEDVLEAVLIQTLKGEEPDDGRELWLPLSTQGHVGIVLKMEVVEEPTLYEMASSFVQPVVSPIVSAYHFPSRLRYQYSTATLRVRLVRGERLPAADGPAIGGVSVAGAGSSDPYVKFALGPPECQKPLWLRWAPVQKLADAEMGADGVLEHAALAEALERRYNLTRWCLGGEEEIEFTPAEWYDINKDHAQPVAALEKALSERTRVHVGGGRVFRPVLPLRAQSKAKEKTLKPVWDEEFTFTGFVRDLTSSALECEVFDEDKGIGLIADADDSLGFAELSQRKMQELFAPKPGTSTASADYMAADEDGPDTDEEEGDGKAAGKPAGPPAGTPDGKADGEKAADRGEIKLDLTTSGAIFIDVAVVDVDKPNYFLLLRRLLQPAIRVYAEIAQLSRRALILKREYTQLTVEVTLHSASNLPAADISFLGRGGSSDPYVNFELAGEVQQSTTKAKELNPTWEDEKFVFHKHLFELEQDEDKMMNIEVYDQDDGPFNDDDLIGLNGLSIEGDLLSQAGKEARRITLPLNQPNKSQQGEITLTVEVKPKVEPLWSDIAYQITLPHLRAFRAFILYYRLPYDLPIWSKLRDPWFYVMTYIGANPNVFIRGGFFTVYLACVACELEEFQVMRFILGLKGSQFISGIIKTIILCFKFWKCSVTSTGDGCAVAGPGVGNSSVLHYLSIICWLQVLLWVAFLILPFTGKLNPQTGHILYTKSRRKWDDAKAFAKEEELKRFKQKKRSQRFREIKNTGSKKELEDFKAEAKQEMAEEAEASAAAAEGRLSKEEEDKAIQRAVELKEGMEKQYNPDTLLGRLQKRLADAHRFYDTVTYPMRSQEKQNRLFSLLAWDTYAFAFCGVLFFVMSVAAQWAQEEILAEAEGRTLNRDPLWHTILVIGDMLSIFSGSFWVDWHTQITFQLIKVFFSLTAVPFFIFTIGPLAKLFAHTDATAYTRDGRMTTPDPNGLSSYLRWIKEDVLAPNAPHVQELEQKFSQKDLLNLRRSVKKAETVLETAWAKPASARKVMTKEKVELDKKLLKVVSKEKASFELYNHCFPDRVLVDEYVKDKSEEKEKANKEEEEKKARKKMLSKIATPASLPVGGKGGLMKGGTLKSLIGGRK